MFSWLPFAAFAISLISITMSLASFARDRGRLVARAHIVYEAEGPEGAFTHPTMTVRLVNLGRRPIVLIDFEAKSKSHRWSWRISGSDGFERKAGISAVHLELAQHSAVRLSEGDIVEAKFPRLEASSFIWTSEDTVEEARQLYVIDCSGRRHRVRGSRKALETLLRAWGKLVSSDQP